MAGGVSRLEGDQPHLSCNRARWFSSFRGQRVRMPRLRLSHESRASTTHAAPANRAREPSPQPLAPDADVGSEPHARHGGRVWRTSGPACA
jgi:hypothetical protein